MQQNLPTQAKIYIPTWVASDGITTVRFLDLNSAKNYCSETGWPPEDLLYIATEVTISEQLGLQIATPQPWSEEMHTEHENSAGKLIGSLWLPDPDCLTEADQTHPNRRQIEILATKCGWPYRDLAAHTEEVIQLVQEYVNGCEKNNSRPAYDGAEQYANAKRVWPSLDESL